MSELKLKGCQSVLKKALLELFDAREEIKSLQAKIKRLEAVAEAAKKYRERKRIESDGMEPPLREAGDLDKALTQLDAEAK